MNKQKKHLMILTICIILFLLVGFFLINNFRNIQLNGIGCMSNPLGYAENRMQEDTGQDWICDCNSKSDLFFYYNNSFS